MTLGRMALISVVAGLLLGSCTSVAPFELFFLPPFLFIAFMLWSMRTLRGRHPGHQFLGPIVSLVLAITVVLVAQAMPLKFVDRQTIQLESPCATVREVAARAELMPGPLPPSFAETRVCVSSSNPTLREVMHVCEQQANVTVRVGYCGNGATFLWGAHPIGGPTFEPRSF